MEYIIKIFHELKTNELYEILKQRINVFVVEQNCPYHECDDKDYKAIHVFAKEKNIITAYLRILLPGASYDEVSIGRVLVNKDYRRHGLSRKLMKKAIEYIKEEMNQNAIRISAQEYLVEFYRSLGFNTVSDAYLEDNIPHVEMLYDT